MSERTIDSFQKGILADIADTKQGFATGNNNHFLKFWQEVAWNTVGLNCDSRETAKESLKNGFLQIKVEVIVDGMVIIYTLQTGK